MDRLFIKPATTGLIVRDPITYMPVIDAGEYKPRNVYWLRRLRDGDVVEADPNPKATKRRAKTIKQE